MRTFLEAFVLPLMGLLWVFVAFGVDRFGTWKVENRVGLAVSLCLVAYFIACIVEDGR